MKPATIQRDREPLPTITTVLQAVDEVVWYEMAALEPQTGRSFMLRDPQGNEHRAMWKRTRRYDDAARRWVPHAIWIHHDSKQPIAFQPTAWRTIA